jgi:aspartate-semialdehyde dehydrogenase
MPYNIAVVGFGLVGKEIVRLLNENAIPVKGQPKILATRARREQLDGRTYQVLETADEHFTDIDLAIFAGSEGAKGASTTFGWKAVENGAVVIDNSSDFRMDPRVPLVVPEVNFNAITPEHRFIANPNCSTIQMVAALAPIHRAVGIKRIIVSTYQAVSGWGTAAVKQLKSQVEDFQAQRPIQVDPSIFARQIAFNVVPQIDRFHPNAFTKEEMKMVNETRKIFADSDILISATCARVPVFRGHAESVTIETKKHLAPEDVRRLLKEADEAGEGQLRSRLIVVDEPSDEAAPEKRFPTPIDADSNYHVYVGRIRQDPVFDNGLSLWVVSDNLLKGAALNAVQIAEMMHLKGIIRPA